MDTSWYTITPDAPLVFRSGKPFGAGSRDGANFPWPSSLAGLMRTQIMDAQGLEPWRDPSHQAQLQALPAAGPFPLECTASGAPREVWLPKPADAVLLRDEDSGALTYHRLAPAAVPEGAGSDLPHGLRPVAVADKIKGKPQPGPAWWPLSSLLDWMSGKPVDPAAITARCEQQPWQVAQRTHVGIDRSSMAAENGRLFQTDGLDFSPRRKLAGGRPDGWATQHFSLLAQGPAGISPGLVTFGGERRLSWLAPHTGTAFSPPAGWSKALTAGFALTLITPALFTDGWKPGWLSQAWEGELPGVPGLRVRLAAAALERWQAVSGWDLATQQPRASRKAVPAGATYWFEVVSSTPEALEQLWLCRLCDHEQDRRDGFGLALPRPWNPALSGNHAA